MTFQRNLFFEIQFEIYRFFGVIITKEELISIVYVIIEKIEKMHFISFEDRKNLIEYIYESLQAVLSNDIKRLDIAKEKDALNIMKSIINNIDIKPNIKQTINVILENRKNQIDKRGF